MATAIRVVVADEPEGVATIRNVLNGEAEILVASTLDEALLLLNAQADLIVCGIHFDGCRMFDLLRRVEADPQSRQIRFVCFRDMMSELSPPFFESLQIACSACGARAFLDLFELKSQFGVDEADRLFRAILINENPPIEQQREITAARGSRLLSLAS